MANLVKLNGEDVWIYPLSVGCLGWIVAITVCVVVWKIIRTCITFVKLIWKNSPDVLVFGVCVWVFALMMIIIVVPGASNTFFFDHRDDWIWKLSGDVWRWPIHAFGGNLFHFYLEFWTFFLIFLLRFSIHAFTLRSSLSAFFSWFPRTNKTR